MKKVLKKVVEYFRKNWRLGKASTVTMVLAISMMSLVMNVLSAMM